MRLSRFFIDRPIFAAVIAAIITIVGLVSYFFLPVSQYPEIVPPTVTVTAAYPGASAETVAETVASLDRAGNQRRREYALSLVASRRAMGAWSSPSPSRPARISMPRRCWCRTALPSPCRACRRKCSVSASSPRRPLRTSSWS